MKTTDAKHPVEPTSLLGRLLHGAYWYGAEWYWTVTGGVLLLLIILITLLAPVLSPFDPTVSAGGPFEPPGGGRVVLLAPQGSGITSLEGITVAAYYNTTAALLAEERGLSLKRFQVDKDLFEQVRAGKAQAVLFSARKAPEALAANPDFVQVGGPFGPRFWLGTDNLGRDILSRLIWGARAVLTVAILSALFSALVGVPLGLLSGFFGGRFDRVLSLIMDSIYSFPGLILAIAVAAVLGTGVINIAIAIAVVYIPTYFRMTRSQVLSIKEELYVEAARALGSRKREILGMYIFPNVVPTLVVVFSLNVADAILTEAGLAFLGLGLQPPTPDWGFDLNKGKAYLPRGYWWPITFPGLMITLVALGFSLLGEGLGELLNPRLTEE
ncbi:MAG TPA: ABC transporter permease subunit [Anaerolineae bacterium]|nr:ABC transporter permease subunit [Anaerolineae bacterium]HIQ08718.1 ABC transporter permease subunit [Anaerolineaceae bacterium]